MLINKKQIDETIFLLIISSIALAIASQCTSAFDPFWHIKVGEWIINHHQVPHNGIFSFTKNDAPWVPHEWLSAIIIYLVYKLGDWSALVCLSVVCTITSLFIIANYTLKYTSITLTSIFILFAFFLLTIHISPRPHLIALPVLTLWTTQLFIAADSQSPPKLWLLPVMTLWSNLHGSFIIGIAFACFFAFESLIITKKNQLAINWGYFIVLSVIAAGMTPHGWAGFTLPFDLLDQHYIIDIVSEWASPNFHGIHPFEVWLLALLTLCLVTGFKLPLLRTFFLLGLIHLSLKHVRYVADLLSVISPLLLTRPLQQHFRLSAEQSLYNIVSNTKAIVFLVVLGALVIAITANRNDIITKEHQNLLDVLGVLHSEKDQLGRVLNSYETGGFLIYKGFSVFMDSRGELYKDEFVKDYFEAINLEGNADKINHILGTYNIRWTLFETNAKINILLENQSDWQKIYHDKHFTIFTLNANILRADLINQIKLLNQKVSDEQRETPLK